MLSVEDNERLARVGRGTPMGSLMRRFWIPFMVQHDLPEADGPPVRVTLLGESLIAFRGASGRVGLVERRCAHRRADLFFGRNEENGLRCTYHGWKYDATGRCVDMPTESAESAFADKVSIVAYPVRERAGVLWTYMGPKEYTPEMPEFEWANAPDANRYVSWNVQECNFAQAIEGGIDTIHSVFLHSSMDSHRRRDDWEAEGRRTNNPRLRFRTDSNPPKMQTQDTDFGIVIGARYAGDDDANYWRFNLFYMPFYTAPPGQETQKSVHAFVPLDDVTTARWTFTLSDSPMSARQRALFRKGSGLHSEVYPGTHFPTHNVRTTTTRSTGRCRSSRRTPASRISERRTTPSRRAWVLSLSDTSSTSARPTSGSSRRAAGCSRRPRTCARGSSLPRRARARSTACGPARR